MTISRLISRPPAVAGMFYPGAPSELAATVDQLLAEVPTVETPQPKALIVPHAGYIYSGATAAMAYASAKTVRARASTGSFCSARRTGLRSTVWRCPKPRAFTTPLGNIRLDQAAIAQIADLPQIIFSDPAHAQEHSLEVHMPFLQRVLDNFTVVPLAVGHASPQAVAEVLDLLWGGPETLIVISSDLSHFLPYADANRIDRDTCQHILHLDTHIPAQPSLRRLSGQWPVAHRPAARSGAPVDLSLQFR
jgi:AmmeMemoRadiSam system protein B